MDATYCTQVQTGKNSNISGNALESKKGQQHCGGACGAKGKAQPMRKGGREEDDKGREEGRRCKRNKGGLAASAHRETGGRWTDLREEKEGR